MKIENITNSYRRRIEELEKQLANSTPNADIQALIDEYKRKGEDAMWGVSYGGRVPPVGVKAAGAVEALERLINKPKSGGE